MSFLSCWKMLMQLYRWFLMRFGNVAQMTRRFRRNYFIGNLQILCFPPLDICASVVYDWFVTEL